MSSQYSSFYYLMKIILDSINAEMCEDLSIFISMIHAFNSTPLLNHEEIVYRGIESQFFNPMENEIIGLSLISTSDDIEEASNFTDEYDDKIILEIKLPIGTKIITIGDLSYNSRRHCMEKGEIILLPCRLVIDEIIAIENTKIVKCTYFQLESIEDTIGRLVENFENMEI